MRERLNSQLPPKARKPFGFNLQVGCRDFMRIFMPLLLLVDDWHVLSTVGLLIGSVLLPFY